MSGANSTSLYALWMLLAGLGIPIMAALNGGLASKLGSTTFAITLLFSVAGVLSLIHLINVGGVPSVQQLTGVSLIFFMGGLFVWFYVASITWVGPRFGIGNAVSMVLMGQLISIAVIDHFGVFGAKVNELSLQRSVGLILMVFGVLLVVRRG